MEMHTRDKAMNKTQINNNKTHSALPPPKQLMDLSTTKATGIRLHNRGKQLLPIMIRAAL
jgi:hypothetical protein